MIVTEKTHKPMTVVGPITEVSLQEMANRVLETREKHGALLQKYHEVWYESGHTWVFTNFCGIGMMKSPNDLWAYHDIIVNHRPKTIIETGSYQGGSALWFAFLQEAMGIRDGRVFTIDMEDRRACAHPRITFLGGDSTDPFLLEAILEEVGGDPGPMLVSLDADHSEAHVRKELEIYGPALQVGDWCVVEDTNIGWTGEGGDRGARGGLETFLRDHPGEFAQDVLSERWLLTMHPGGFLQRVRPHAP